MQERSEAERRAIWPCLNVATWHHTTNMLFATKYNQMKIIAGMEFFRRIE